MWFKIFQHISWYFTTCPGMKCMLSPSIRTMRQGSGMQTRGKSSATSFPQNGSSCSKSSASEIFWPNRSCRSQRWDPCPSAMIYFTDSAFEKTSPHLAKVSHLPLKFFAFGTARSSLSSFDAALNTGKAAISSGMVHPRVASQSRKLSISFALRMSFVLNCRVTSASCSGASCCGFFRSRNKLWSGSMKCSGRWAPPVGNNNESR